MFWNNQKKQGADLPPPLLLVDEESKNMTGSIDDW